MSALSYPPVLVVAVTSSHVGKTTITCSIMAAFASLGYIVRPFKVGPDFIDGQHHEAACKRASINLDGWLMGGKAQVLESFHRHAQGADICIVEGVMGLFDGKDGTSDEGSTAQVAKWLQAPVILVVDAGCMARSVAAMMLGYTVFDDDLRCAGVVVNKVNGSKHKQWIQEALECDDRLRDVGTNEPILFVGAFPKDKTIAIPERHLGLHLPHERRQDYSFVKLAQLAKEHLNLDGLMELAQSATTPSMPTGTIVGTIKSCCRIAIARDEAFHFYYHDNLKLLQAHGAEIIYFSPVHDERLPNDIDAIYIGGGYPELHAKELQANESMRLDIQSFSLAGGVVYAECGGLMYLSTALWTLDKETQQRERFEMCNVLSDTIVTMTPHMKMYYAEIQITEENPIFSPRTTCRGQQFHFSEVAEAPEALSQPFMVTPQQPDAVSEPTGFIAQRVVASYFHLHWASQPSMARDFVVSAIRHSPTNNKADVVSFVSAATEIVFALGAEQRLAGVTSVCDYPIEARHSPRQVLCQSPIDATIMSSEEVAAAMKELQERHADDNRPPGHWMIDKVALKRISPRIALVQETCDICDASKSDVLCALDECGLSDSCETVQVSPTTLEQMFESIRAIGDVLGISERSNELCESLRNRLEVVEQKLASRETIFRPRVLSLEGLAPLCVGGGWLPDVKRAAGCEDALGDIGGAPARIIEWKEVVNADPDVLVISPCSASTTRTLNELHLLNSPEFWKLRCVQEGKMFVMDYGRFSRPGPRLVEAVEMLSVLICNVLPPEHVIAEVEWRDVALKYECCEQEDCTTDLSSRFRPCFGNEETSIIDGDNSSFASRGIAANELLRIKVNPCSNFDEHLPDDRCAHSMVTLRDGSILLLAGDSSDGCLSDIWRLSPPLEGWKVDLDRFDSEAAPRLGRSPVWERLEHSSIANEDVPTPRSNSAAVVCGDFLLTFGGWGEGGQCLENCELLHLETVCWTQCSTRGSERPSPRGNPTLVYSNKRNEAILFGGWNKVDRLDELWVLDMNTWEWKKRLKQNESDPWPLGRTDHSSVLWIDENGNESMLVFGGSVEGTGCTSELWLYHLEAMEWERLHVEGSVPTPRTSHCTAIVGRGKSCKMIVVGGTGNGSGQSALSSDAWALDLQTLTWEKLVSWKGSGVERCRHGMAVVDIDKIMVCGGYNGKSVVQDDASVWFGCLDNNGCEGDAHVATVTETEHSMELSRLQDRWEAEVPVREADLPSDMLEKAKKSSLPGALIKALHRYAVSTNRDTYIDPATGYSVFTQTYLKRRACCGNGCRHCPYGHINLPEKKRVNNRDTGENDDDDDTTDDLP